MAKRQTLGGVIHTYQKYDPKRFPNPTQPPPDAVSPAFEHMLMFGNMRRLSPEELARAVKIDPSQIAGLGPGIDALLAILLERKRKILAKYETDTVQDTAAKEYRAAAGRLKPPRKLEPRFQLACEEEYIAELERIWYAVDDERSALWQGSCFLAACIACDCFGGKGAHERARHLGQRQSRPRPIAVVSLERSSSSITSGGMR